MASGARALIAALILAQSGQFALYRGTLQIRSEVRLVAGNELDVVQYPLHANAPITRYDNGEGDPIHVVLVRDDFRSFSHVHADAAVNGVFHVRVVLDAGHRYYAFVGSKPSGYAPQVFRFTLQAGAPPHHVATTFDTASTIAGAGPYRVTLSSARLTARKPRTIVAVVTKQNGARVRTRPFRGAEAHTVFVNIETLQYIHADAPRSSGAIELRVPPLTNGAYRMWLEFSDGKSIFAAPFTLVAQ